MKSILTIILCGALLHATTAQLEADDPPPPDGVAIIVFVLCCCAAGAALVISVHSRIPSQKVPVTLVLDKTTDLVTWTPIFTNTVVLNGTNRLEFFRAQMTDESAWYRARVQR